MKNALRLFLWMALVTGILYPLLITAIAQGAFRRQAEGDIVTVRGQAVGARLMAQKFEKEVYFWPRPSSIDYNPLPSGGSNLGPTSALLRKAVEERRSRLQKSHPGKEIPSEMLFASGSGLDPHLSLKAIDFQIDRVVKARGMDPEKGRERLEKLIESHLQGGGLGLWGNPYVNVLILNSALDDLQMAKP